MDFIGITVGVLRVIFGLVFILFLPGFFMTLALYATKEEIPVISRAALSIILSIVTLMLSTLFLDYVTGLDTTPVNIFFTLTVIIILMFLIWRIRCLFSGRPIRIYRK